MSSTADMAERHARVLAELAELGLAFARDARADAEAAETPEQRAQQALVFQRVSRSVRQSLALEAKLARDAGRDAREEAERQAKQDRGEVHARRDKVRHAVDALIWREAETLDEEAEAAFDEAIDDAVYAEACSGSFLTDPLADQVARVLGSLGFEVGPGDQVRRIAQPTAAPAPQPAWQGSG